MPSISELIDQRGRATQAQKEAQKAEQEARTAAEAAGMAHQALDTARKRETEAQSRLGQIRDAITQIPVVEADLQTASRSLTAVMTQRTELDAKIADAEADLERYRTVLPYEVPPELLDRLKQLQKERDVLVEQEEALQIAVDTAQERLKQLKSDAEDIDKAKEEATDAASELQEREEEVARLDAEARAAATQAVNSRTTAQTLEAAFRSALDQLIAGLSPDLPIALLPVRIETRFMQGELRIRVYPDDIHQDTHELGLTAEEARWGKHFWMETWRAGRAMPENSTTYSQRRAQELAPWQKLATRFGPARAAYIAQVLTPLNSGNRPTRPTDTGPLTVEPEFDLTLPQRRASWTRAAQARGLPDRWLAIAYGTGASGKIRKTGWGDLIPPSLSTGPTPTAASIYAPGSTPAIPVDPEIRWMVDFDEAEKVGMGIRIALTPDEAKNGFDRLLVLGIKGTLSAEAGAHELHDLLEAHRFTWGCAFVPQGTPTNNTEANRSGYSREDVDFQTSFTLERESLEMPVPGDSDGATMARALGLSVTDLARLRYADGYDQRDAADFNRVLWPVTLGYFLEQFLNDIPLGYHRQQWREYFVQFVRARGPLPALRIGKQPYGVLPVTSLDRWISGRSDLVDLLRHMRGVWRSGLTRIAYAGRDQSSMGSDLVEVLGQEAISSSYTWRWARGPRFFDLYWHLPGQQIDDGTLATAADTLRTLVDNALQHIGLSSGQLTRLSRMTFAGISFDWQGHLVEIGEVSETQTLTHNYIHNLVDLGCTLDDIHDETDRVFPINQPKPLLYRLLRHATLLAYAEQALIAWPLGPRTSIDAPWFEPELVDMEFDWTGEFDPSKTPTFWRVLQDVPAGQTVNRGTSLRNLGRLAKDPLGSFLFSLNRLSTLSTAALERLLGETLDLSSHRLDAWITSLATYRLSALRGQKPEGIQLGSYGWVEDLRPRITPSLSDGYIHAPSIAQAATAAVLRSGYMAHQSDPVGARLEIDLSSRRVRLALGLIDGVRQGQPLGALLGYRFERMLHDTNRQLNRIIVPLRQLAPLAGSQLIKDGAETIEAVAANNVVDGLKLLEDFQQGNIPFAQFNLTQDERTAVDAALNAIRDAVDAIGDLALAEGVHQAVHGNYLRGGATLDAISRGEAPGEIQVINTPQSGMAFTQRLIALFPASPSGRSTWNRNRARAQAEPALNRWAEQLLGAPERVRCKAQYFNPGKDPFTDTPDHIKDLTLKRLELCALDIVYAPPITGEARQTELELRLARAAMQIKPNKIASDAQVRLVFARDEDFEPDELTFPDLFELARAARTLFTNGRAVDARDFSLAGSSGEPSIAAATLDHQADNVINLWGQTKKTLTDLFVVGEEELAILKSEKFNLKVDVLSQDMNLLDIAETLGDSTKFDLVAAVTALDLLPLSSLNDLRDALENFSAFAVQSAVPRSIYDATEKARLDLVAQAQSVFAQVKHIDQLLEKIENNRLAQLAALLGESFRALSPFTLNPQHDFHAALQRRKDANDAETEQTIPWLQMVANVREGAKRLTTILSYSEINGANEAMTFRVAQIPFSETDAWNVPEGPALTGATSIVVYGHNRLYFTQELVGLMLDEWVEVIPNRAAQTALTFHYDAPGAQAPQSILLAVSPDPAKPWDIDTLEAILNETLDIVKLRTVDYDALSRIGHLLPAIFLANNVGSDPHGDTVSSEFTQ